MKLWEYVYSNTYGVCLICSFPNPHDTTLAIAAVIVKRPDDVATADFKILNESDAVPIDIDPKLADLRTWLMTGRRAP